MLTKIKNPLSLLRQRADKYACCELLLRTVRRARRVAVMMMVSMRPAMVRDGHLLNESLAKPAFAVNPC
jgi:hypothetical protein